MKKPVLNLDTSPSSPDFSPASVTSSLLQTPTDLSPSRSTFDSKLYSPYELTHSLPYLPQSQSQPSLLFDHSNSPPSRIQESFISHSPSYSNRPSYSSQPTFIANQQSGAFEPFSSVESQSGYHTNPQHASATHGMPRPLYNSPPQAQVSRRVDHTRQLPLPPIGMDWRLAQAHGQYHQQLPPAPPSTQSDWVLSEELGSLKSDYGKHEYITGAVCSEEPLRGSYVFQQQAPQTTSHEVCSMFLFHPCVFFFGACAYIHFVYHVSGFRAVCAHTSSSTCYLILIFQKCQCSHMRLHFLFVLVSCMSVHIVYAYFCLFCSFFGRRWSLYAHIAFHVLHLLNDPSRLTFVTLHSPSTSSRYYTLPPLRPTTSS